MNILLDFSAIKTGGGAQLAMNFVDYARASEWSRHYQLHFVFPEEGPLAARASEFCNTNVLISPQRYLERIRFEYGALQQVIRSRSIGVIFTFFGAGVPAPRQTRRIVSVAYPTICYPESPYWQNLPIAVRLKQRLLDFARVSRLRQADLVLVETEVMRERLARTLRRPEESLVVMPPSPSSYLPEQSVAEGLARFEGYGKLNILVLSAIYPHKNLWRLPGVLRELSARSIDNVVFNISITKEQFLWLCHEMVEDSLLDRYMNFLGAIPPQKIADLYRSNHVMLNISDLESFSNNYMEAWKSAMPILASDRDFSRAICGDSAVYVDPHDPVSVVDGLLTLMTDGDRRFTMLQEGKQRLRQLLQPNERYDRLMRLLTETR